MDVDEAEKVGSPPNPNSDTQTGTRSKPCTNGFHAINGTKPPSSLPVNGTQVDTNKPETEINISVPWGHISAKAYGLSTGRPVLAVHGWMDNAGSFDRLIPLLSDSFYIVAVDLPGHGLSSHIPLGTPYDLADFIISLRRIVKYLNWTKFSWLGHSMGAGLGALYASSFPTQVEYLIMLDLTKPITWETGNDYAIKIGQAVEQFLALEEKIQPIPPTHTYEDALSRVMTGMWGNLSEESAKALMARGARCVGENEWCFVRDLRLRSPPIFRMNDEQCSKILSKMRCSTLVIKASDAPWFEPQELCENAMNIYRKSCPVFHFVEVDGNHFVHLNQPENCAGHINQFLTDGKLEI